MLIRPDGSIYDLNASCQDLIGVEKEGIVDKDFRSFEPLKRLKDRVTQSMMNSTEDFAHIIYKNRDFEVSILPFVAKGNLTLIRLIFKDITNFSRLEKELIKRNKELIIMNTLSSAFISSDNIDSVIEDLIERVLLITDFGISWLVLKEDKKYTLKASRGISPGFKKNMEDGLLDPLYRDSTRKKEPLYILDSSDISRNNLLQNEGIVFLVAVPLLSTYYPTGLLFFASREKRDEMLDFDMASILSLVGNNVSLILEKINLFQETKRLSITDSLTGLYNRRYFYKSLNIELARSKRYETTFSLMLFDIDNFKKINDTYGHHAGDKVLQEIANILKSISRETDIIVRYGGEEFIIILPNTAEEETIALANRIKNIVEETIFTINDAACVNITLSGGIASCPLNATRPKSLLSAADSALYAAKAAGKNTILCFKGTVDD